MNSVNIFAYVKYYNVYCIVESNNEAKAGYLESL